MPLVVITGGTAGVGRATALCFARHGYDVAVIARSHEGLAKAVREIETLGVSALGYSADVADDHQMRDAADHIVTTLGPVAVWINVAMCTVIAPFTQIEAAEYQRITDVTYHGVVNGTREALRVMTDRGQGHIIQTGSALAYRSIPLQSPYCGAKAAIRGFTDSLRSEILHTQSPIHLTMVHLPAVNTPQFDWSRNKLPHPARPVAPVYQPEAVAEAIFKATRTAPRELWVGKATVQSILGNMFFPGWLDKLLAKKAWNGQMDFHEDTSDDRDNLYAPVEGYHQAQGRFSRESKRHVTAIDPTRTGKVLLATLGVLSAVALGRRWTRRR